CVMSPPLVVQPLAGSTRDGIGRNSHGPVGFYVTRLLARMPADMLGNIGTNLALLGEPVTHRAGWFVERPSSDFPFAGPGRPPSPPGCGGTSPAAPAIAGLTRGAVPGLK